MQDTPPLSNMSSLDIAASPPNRGDETVRIAFLPAFAGGHLGVLRNVPGVTRLIVPLRRGTKCSEAQP